MKLIKIVIIAILLYSCDNNMSKYKQEIELCFNNYMKHLVNKEFEEGFNYMPNELFQYISRHRLKGIYEETYKDDVFDITLYNPEVKGIEDSIKIEDKYYAILSFKERTDFKIKTDNKSQEEKEQEIKALNKSFKKTFGYFNVTYRDESTTFEVRTEKRACAILNEESKADWKFLILEKDNLLLQKLIPKKLFNELW